MPVRYKQSTKRALVSLLKRLTIKYKLYLDLRRDSNDADVRKSPGCCIQVVTISNALH